jgi:hypothetical protein
MRNVYPTDEIPHLWAHATQYSAYNPTHNLSFDGAELRSYSTVIATRHQHQDGSYVYLISRETYSVTTAKHLSYVRQAIHPSPSFTVDNVRASNKKEHNANVLELLDRAATDIDKASRARSNKEYLLASARNLIATAKAYAEIFGATLPPLPPDDKLNELASAVAKRKANESAAQKRRNTIAQKKRELERTQACAIALEILQRWQAGKSLELAESDKMRYALNFAYARIEGDELATTLGARVPLEHVRRALPIVLRAIAQRATMSADDVAILPALNLRVGHFSIDNIHADGTVAAGCHLFERTEVERLNALVSAIPPTAPTILGMPIESTLTITDMIGDTE